MSKFFSHVQLLIHGILNKFHAGNLDAAMMQAIIAKAAVIVKEVQNGQLDPEVEATAISFVHGMVQNSHVLNLTDDQIKILVEKAVEMARELHKTQAPPAAPTVPRVRTAQPQRALCRLSV